MTTSKKKILWISDFNCSGYSLVSNILIPFLQPTYDVSILVINSPTFNKTDCGKDITFDIDVNKIFNVKLPDELLTISSTNNYWVNYTIGIFDIPKILKDNHFDYIFSLNDYQILTKHLGIIDSCNFKGKTIVYMPIDAESYKKDLLNNLNKADHILTMTHNSKKIIQNTGIYKAIEVLEHALCENIIAMEDKHNFRAEFFGDIIKDEDFIIMNVNGNSFRKRLDLTIEAFYKLHLKNVFTQKIFLVLKTTNYSGQKDTYNFNDVNKALVEKYKINLTTKIIIKTDKYSTEDLNKLFNCADMYVSTTSGEGWGLTAFEFLKADIFCLVPDNTSYSEYFHELNRINTQKKTFYEGRSHKIMAADDFYSNFALFTYDPLDNKIKYTNVDNVVSSHIIKICPNGEFNSLKSFIDSMIDDKREQQIPYVFKIVLYIDVHNNFEFVQKIMEEYAKLDFSLFFNNYYIQTIPKNNFDHLIVKVGIVVLDDMVKKMNNYIKNPIISDELNEYNKKLLAELTVKKIGSKLVDIFENIDNN